MKSDKSIFFTLMFLSLFEAGKTVLTARLLSELSSVLKLRGVTIVTGSLEVRNSKQFFKDASVSSTLKVIRDSISGDHDTVTDSLIVMMSGNKTENDQSEWWDHLGYGSPSLLTFDSMSKMLEQTENHSISINQKVFCFTEEEGEILEVYIVGEEVVKNTLWTFDNSSSKFIRNDDLQEDFVLRRSNFHGSHLRVLMDEQAPYLYIKHEDKLEDSDFGEEFYKLENNMLSGMFWDLQAIMESELNFTSSYLLRRDRRWGDGDGNGSFTGMVGSAHANKVDMICASLTLKPSRAEGISFLHPIVFTNYALFIPSLGREDWAWTVFLLPFDAKVWLALWLLAILGAFLLRTLSNQTESSAFAMVVNNTSLLLNLCASYFGRGPPSYYSSQGLSNPVRVAVFVLFFCGVLIWSAYRASLTSKLVVHKHQMPFDSLEGFLNSDYQLMIQGGGIATEHTLRSAPKGSIYNRLFEKNYGTEEQVETYMVMGGTKPVIEMLWNSEVPTAFLEVMDTVEAFKEYTCRLSKPWSSSLPIFFSMATAPGSPYLPFMRRFILKHIEKGTVYTLNRRWRGGDEDCSLLDSQPLGRAKTLSLFSLWAFGAFLAVTFFLAEHIASYFHAYRRRGNRVITPGKSAKMSHHEARLAQAIRNTMRRYEDKGDKDKLLIVARFKEILHLMEVER